MEWGIMNYAAVHFIWGLFLGGVSSCILFKNRKWRPFRFGGISPLSLGWKGRWLTWLCFAFILEYVISIWFGDKKLDLWGIEAVILTLGLFISDRVAMMLEPENLWMPKDMQINMSGTPETSNPKNGAESTWAEKKLEQTSKALDDTVNAVKEKAAETISDIGDGTEEIGSKAKEKVSGSVSKIVDAVGGKLSFLFASRQAKAEAKQKAKADEKQKRTDRFHDLTKGF